jgi:integrase
MENQGKAGSYISSNLKALKSCLSHNGVETARRIKVRGAHDTPTLRGTKTLSAGELWSLFQNSPLLTRCVCALIAQAGLRPEVIGNYDATDGLTVGDLPELKVWDGNVAFLNIPTIITVRQELSKAGHQYFTFLGSEGCEYLQEYLTQRIGSGEKIDQSTPLVAPKRSSRRFFRTSLVSRMIRKKLRKCNIHARPYDLRHTFATRLLLAESQGIIPQDYRIFLMGQKGDIENRYNTGNRSLPEKLVEDMRTSYSRSQTFLQSQGPLSDAHNLIN